MNPALAIHILTQYVIPAGKAGYDIVKTWQAKQEITDADWQDLLAINARPLEFYEGKVMEPKPIPTMPWNEKP